MSRTPASPPAGLRVLLAGPVPPPWGGIARYVQDLLDSDLARRHHLIHFNTAFSARVRTQAVNPGHGRYQSHRRSFLSRYAYLFSGGGWQGLKTLAAGLWTVPRLALTLAATAPQVVHVFANMHWGFWRAGLLVWTARLAGARVIFHPLGALEKFYPAHGRLGRRLIRFLLDRADLVLVQSPGLAGQIRAFTGRPVEGIFNGINLEPLTGLQRAARGQGPVTFVAVGDLGHNKGTWEILEAAGRLCARAPDTRWLLVGRGDLEDLHRRAAAAGCAHAVTFTGSVDEAGKLAALAAADIFLLPSHAEGQPLSILEAMAAGLPVITTPVGSIGEVVEDGVNGLLIPPGDVEALTSAMERLAGDPGLCRQMAAANRDAAARRFDVRRLRSDLESRWLRLTAEPAP